jgi:hypothetical protein
MDVAALSPAACREVEDFVREALGCACPPAVFEDIRLETGPAGISGIPGGRLLAIGGRLLVLLVDETTAALTQDVIKNLLRQGRDLRDAGGFNRFRLVIVASSGSEPGALAGSVPDTLDPVDDRVHLHMLAVSQLPALLRAPVEGP